MSFLRNGDVFPEISVARVGGGQLHLPRDLAGSYGVVLFYRGAWCPYCVAQLTGFERAKARLAAIEVKVVAMSVESEATTRELVDKHGLAMPIGYSADAAAIAQATGAYINRDPVYLQTAGFVLSPEGTVINAVYSSLAIGRLVAEDVAGLVTYLKSKKDRG